jgi:hypothetical protein
MASFTLIRVENSPFWYAYFLDREGKRFRRSTKEAERPRALRRAQQLYEDATGACAPLTPPSTRGLYFVLAGAKLKIGKADDIAQRLRALQTASPEPLALVATMPGAFAQEAVLHARFKRLHIRGEWYRYEAELQDFVRSLRPLKAAIDADVLVWGMASAYQTRLESAIDSARQNEMS